MQVTLRLLSQESFNVPVDASATIGDLKKKIEETRGANFAADTLRLVYAGKVLDDDSATLEAVKYTENAFIVVMVKKPTLKPTDTASTSKADEARTTAGSQSAAAAQPASNPAAPAPQAVAPGSDVRAAAPAGLLPPQGAFGISPEKYNEMVDAIVQMGYPKSEVESALRASYFNAERAVEYLISGIPASAGLAPMAPAMNPGNPAANVPAGAGGGVQQRAPAAAAGTGAPPGVEALAGLAGSPQLEQMRQMIAQNPELLQTLMASLQQANPALFQAISSNPEAFLNMLNAEGLEGEGEEEEGDMNLPEGLEELQAALAGGGGGGPGGQGVHYVNVTPEENAAIERLKALGFPEQMVIEAFIACDKNEEMAANLLLSNLDELDQGGGR